MDFLIANNITVDAIITDPPYSVTGFSWDNIIPFDKMWKRLNKLIKDNGAIVLFGNEPFSSNLRMSNISMYKYDWKWIKSQVTGFQNSKHQPLRCYEDIMVFSKGSAVSNATVHMCFFPQGRISTNVKTTVAPISYLRETDNFKRKEYLQEFSNYPRNVLKFPRENILYHPTQKPVNLMEYIVLTYTNKNDLVLDFTSGSGSTLLACESTNRRWIGIELSEQYCAVIKKRISTGIQLKLFFDEQIEQNKKEE